MLQSAQRCQFNSETFISERLNLKNANKTPKVSKGDTVIALEVDLAQTSVGKQTEEYLHSGLPPGRRITQLYTGHHIHTLCDCWKQCPTPAIAMGDNACPLGSAMYAVAHTHVHTQTHTHKSSCYLVPPSVIFILLDVYKAGGSAGCSRS